MEKRKLNRITAGFIVLVVMVLILMFSNSLRRSSHITLPEEGSSPGQAEDTNASGGDALTVIAVTPETVQTAIETLTRPRQYSRVIRVEQLWDGGSGSFETTVTVSGRWTRTDRSLSDGQVRHTITDGEITYIWYGSESSVYSAPAGDITPDDEQAIPTYESILDLPVEDIAAADYRSVSDVNCIYVETVQDPEGYTQRYWVSVETGLLVASERLLEGETIYRMASLTADLSTPSTDRFILPDGTVVNQYESEEYKAAYQQMRDFYNKGYLRKDVATMKDGQSQKSNGQFFTFPVNLKPCYADELNILAQGKGFTLAQVDVTDIYLTNALGSMQAISRTSKNPQRAAMFLELVNTDKYLNNLINFGVEGVDYEKVSDNVIKLIPDSGYAPNMQWMYGNQFLNFLNETEAPDKWEQFEAFNAKAKQLPDFGFIFDETPVQTEVAATLNIVKEYNNVLKVGAVDPEKTLPEFLNKLREAGSETIVAEMQKQFDEFKKGQE